MARIARGCTVRGCVPALQTSKLGPPRARSSPSAIWEREELWVQRKSTHIGCSGVLSSISDIVVLLLVCFLCQFERNRYIGWAAGFTQPAIDKGSSDSPK